MRVPTLPCLALAMTLPAAFLAAAPLPLIPLPQKVEATGSPFSLTKETVILSMITVPEIMFETQTMMAETFAFAESTLVLALFFVAIKLMQRLGVKKPDAEAKE